MDVLERRLSPDGPIDLLATMDPLRCGAGDPSFKAGPGEFWWAHRTREGPATCRFSALPGHFMVKAWGPGAALALENAPRALGMLDKTPALIDGGPINEMARRMPGLRLGAPGTVFETLSRVIVEQRVTARDAKRSYRRLVLRYGEHAPGPLPLVLPPSPERLYELRYPCYHELGIERRRAETIRRAAYSAARLDETAAMSFEDARRRLRSIPGVGQWTTGYVLRSALGDPDAVILGDFHFPNMVAWALAGEARADDKRMLQLLRPYAGQRGRVMRLLEAAGIRAPKFGPRRRVLAIETF